MPGRLLSGSRRQASSALGALLNAPPSQEGWRALCRALARCDAASLPAVITSAERRLAKWPDELREGPWRWFEAALSGRSEPRLRLVRIGSLMRRGIGDRRLAALVASPDLAGLRVLRLDANRIGAKGAAALAAGPFGKLETLLLGGNRIGDEGAAALARAAGLGHLRTLDLSGNAVGDEGAAALARAPRLKALTNLYLDDNRIGDAGAAALAATRSFPHLAALILDDNPLGDLGLTALAQAPHLPKALRLSWEEVTTDDHRAKPGGARSDRG